MRKMRFTVPSNFIIQLYKDNEYQEAPVNAIVDQSGFQQETYAHSGSGNYYLKIMGPKQWSVIVQVPANPQAQVQQGSKLSLSYLQIVDQLGGSVSSVTVGQQVVLQSSVTNNLSVDQKFAYIMQIKDSEGATVMIAWINGEIPTSKTFDIGLSWIPENKGNYNVDIFVWQSIANPLPLSSKILSKTITVL